MSHFASAVHVVTTDGHAGKRGITVTAACSVSDDPATVLICVNRQNIHNTCFVDNGVYAINTLATEHEELARAFSGIGGLAPAERFAMADWQTMATGSPVLDGALAVLDCRIVEAMEAGTHTVLIGRVSELRIGDNRTPLVYHDRGYRRL